MVIGDQEGTQSERVASFGSWLASINEEHIAIRVEELEGVEIADNASVDNARVDRRSSGTRCYASSVLCSWLHFPHAYLLPYRVDPIN